MSISEKGVPPHGLLHWQPLASSASCGCVPLVLWIKCVVVHFVLHLAPFFSCLSLSNYFLSPRLPPTSVCAFVYFIEWWRRWDGGSGDGDAERWKAGHNRGAGVGVENMNRVRVSLEDQPPLSMLLILSDEEHIHLVTAQTFLSHFSFSTGLFC